MSKAQPFRFEKMWSTRKDFDTLVKKTWSTKFSGPNMFCLVSKCKVLKAKIKIWNQTQFGNIFRQLRLVDSQLQRTQQQLLANADLPSVQKRQTQLINKRSKLLSYSEDYWKQKSKTTYLAQGDANTKYYHAHATIRRNRNQIRVFTRASVEQISRPLDIAKAISNEFKDRFLSNNQCGFVDSDFRLLSPVVSSEDNLFLTSPISDEEIKGATFDMAPDKSPGPDGFPLFFFQQYWTLVGNSVIRAVKAFFHSGHLLREINHTFLALIPNIDNPSTTNHFRPISLCSTIY